MLTPSISVHRASMKLLIWSCSSRYSVVAALTMAGSYSPSRCHSRQPSTAQRRIPGASVANCVANVVSTANVSRKGTSLILRHMPWLSSRMIGFSLTRRKNFADGINVNGRPYGWRAFTASFPVSDFTNSSFNRPSLATSELVTNLRPASDAFWYSDIESVQLAEGNGIVQARSTPKTWCIKVSIRDDLPLAPVPNRIQIACSLVTPVNV